MLEQYEKESDILMESMLEHTFFEGFRNPEDPIFTNSRDLELQINNKCDLKCKYCYLSKFEELGIPRLSNDVILKNLDILLNWLSDTNKKPNSIALFSGEIFSQSVGFKVLDRVVDFCSSYGGKIEIPTNMNFVHNESKKRQYITIHNKAERLGVTLQLSASVDGMYCDSNRPFKNKNKERNYKDIFEFCSLYKIPFHPMIYSEGIERWKANFLWFQKMFDKYGINWYSMYLLEVRNVEWSNEQLVEMYKFTRFLVSWLLKKLDFIPKVDFFPTVMKNKVFNLFSMFSTSGRGLGCSIQSALQVRLGDLSVYPCHRLTYDYLKLFKFQIEDGKIIGISDSNPVMWSAIQSTQYENMPYCESCTIKNLCNGQCLGSMFEVNGDMFTPIPTVCALEHVKVAAILDELENTDMLQYLLPYISKDKKHEIELYRRINDKSVK